MLSFNIDSQLDYVFKSYLPFISPTFNFFLIYVPNQKDTNLKSYELSHRSAKLSPSRFIEYDSTNTLPTAYCFITNSSIYDNLENVLETLNLDAEDCRQLN